MSPDRAAASVLPPALELATAYADRDLYWAAVRRVLDDVTSDADPSTAMARLLFGQSVLAGILLDELAASSGRDRAAILAGLHHTYLAQ